MRKNTLIVSLLIILLLSVLAGQYGCGSTSSCSTTTTTTTLPTVDYLETAKGSAVIACGTSFVGQSATQIGGSAVSGALVYNVTAFSGPPDGFFATLPSDGYVTLSAEAVGGNMVPKMALITNGGVKITPSALTNKRIASFESHGMTVRQQMCNELTDEQRQAAIISWVNAYTAEVAALLDPYRSSSTLYRNLVTLADYSAWSYMYPSMESGFATSPFWPAGCHIITPEVTQAEKVGSMECKMTFSGSVTGEITIILATDGSGDPKPMVGTYSSSANLLLPNRNTLEATASLSIVQSGAHDVAPSTITIAGITTPEGVRVAISLNPITGTGTGVLSNEAGVRIATMEVNALGGTLYFDTGSTESFTF
jgi:hypothetical protein